MALIVCLYCLNCVVYTSKKIHCTNVVDNLCLPRNRRCLFIYGEPSFHRQVTLEKYFNLQHLKQC